ncbi:MAG: thiamine phosphate synthase [Rickettsiales bacterium]|nr:thiamine phosphate synthase [Rickettsiales bacterium]
MSNIYLISKPRIPDLSSYAKNLELALSTNSISIFQLRLKEVSDKDWIAAALVTKNLCSKYQVTFILNDRIDLLDQIKPDGIHLGQTDGDIGPIRDKYGNDFIIGRSCYDSKEFAKQAKIDGADYIAFGTFFPSKTKEQIYKPQMELITWAKDELQIHVCAIGGLYPNNLNQFQNHRPDYFCFISAIWDSEDIRCTIFNIHRAFA